MCGDENGTRYNTMYLYFYVIGIGDKSLNGILTGIFFTNHLKQLPLAKLELPITY